MSLLAVCPCGRVPQSLYISDGVKWAFVSPSCCSEWHIEFRTQYNKADTKECMDLAIEAWNSAPRKEMEGK